MANGHLNGKNIELNGEGSIVMFEYQMAPWYLPEKHSKNWDG